jgi:hypothetical protein
MLEDKRSNSDQRKDSEEVKNFPSEDAEVLYFKWSLPRIDGHG